MFIQSLTTIIVSIAFLVFLSFLFSLPVMLLWDAVIPTIFGLPEITWLQAWGLSLLCGLLFKNNTVAEKSK